MKSSDPTTEVLEAMRASEPRDAVVVLGRRIQVLKQEECDGVDLPSLWIAFRRLLHRRGYFSLTPKELAISLEEIAQVGEGFDLYDLARSLAEYDTLRAECLGMSRLRALPELQRFSPRCACGRHG